ncbi:Uncharacterized protein DAT39_000380, partial [Clarias magur]
TVSAAFVHEPAAVWVDTEEKSCPGIEIAMGDVAQEAQEVQEGQVFQPGLAAPTGLAEG